MGGEHLPETVSLLDTIRAAIIHGELSPNQRLVENDLAERYNTSRGAVREALAILQNEGLVARERNRGAWVRPVSIEEAIEITEVRAVLEGLCAAKAAELATADERRDLRALGSAMQAAVRSNDIRTYNDINQRIHRRIRELSRQTTAVEMLDRIRYQSVRYQFSITMLPGRANQGAREHVALIRAVASGNPVQAEQSMREHLLSVIGALRQLADVDPMFGRPSAG
jgi:DNA-binding GntR family transcriptional regulator